MFCTPADRAWAVLRAEAGSWPHLRAILRKALSTIEADRPVPTQLGAFVANCLERVEPGNVRPSLRRCMPRAIAALRSGGEIPASAVEPLSGFLDDILSSMIQATQKARADIETMPGRDAGELLRPVPVHRFLSLDRDLARAFHLLPPATGGRPPAPPPRRALSEIFRELMSYGARVLEAEKILAARYGCDRRTIERWLRAGRAPAPAEFDSYLKARLATAVEALEHHGVESDVARRLVGEAFGLTVEGVAEDFPDVDGAAIVGRAISSLSDLDSRDLRILSTICRAEARWRQAVLSADSAPPAMAIPVGSAGRTFLVCRAETINLYRPRPTRAEMLDMLDLSVQLGEKPGKVAQVARDPGRLWPSVMGLDAALDELRACGEIRKASEKERSGAYDELLASCRGRRA